MTNDREQKENVKKDLDQANPESSNGDGTQLKPANKSIIKPQSTTKEFVKGKYNESFHDGLYRF